MVKRLVIETGAGSRTLIDLDKSVDVKALEKELSQASETGATADVNGRTSDIDGLIHINPSRALWWTIMDYTPTEVKVWH